MKRAVKLFIAAVVGLIVFTGGLCIAQGVRDHRIRAESRRAQAALLDWILLFEERSAL